MAILVDRLASINVYGQASRLGRGFNPAAGRSEKKSWPRLPVRARLKLVPGKTSWRSQGDGGMVTTSPTELLAVYTNMTNVLAKVHNAQLRTVF